MNQGLRNLALSPRRLQILLTMPLGDRESVETLKTDEYEERQNGLIVHFSGCDNQTTTKTSWEADKY